MASCKDCIHSECCFMQYGKTNALKWQSELGCKNFKDRSRFVELPCEVGDILYHPVPLRNMIAEYKIKSFQIYPRVWVNWNIVDGVATINMPGIYAKEIGKTVFLTREEAERALKEREANANDLPQSDNHS